jgi:ribose 5-phosphate isomerase B
MRVAIAFDHRGVALRARIRAELEALGCEIVDLGTDSTWPHVDYPDKAEAVAGAILDGRAERGVLVCSSGVGAAIAACKIPGIRAAICHDPYSAHQGVEHDAMNVLCLGSEIVGGEVAAQLVRAFVQAEFAGGPRHVRRLEKLERLERLAASAAE